MKPMNELLRGLFGILTAIMIASGAVAIFRSNGYAMVVFVVSLGGALAAMVMLGIYEAEADNAMPNWRGLKSDLENQVHRIDEELTHLRQEAALRDRIINDLNARIGAPRA